jgi:hypothetical protein
MFFTVKEVFNMDEEKYTPAFLTFKAYILNQTSYDKVCEGLNNDKGLGVSGDAFDYVKETFRHYYTQENYGCIPSDINLRVHNQFHLSGAITSFQDNIKELVESVKKRLEDTKTEIGTHCNDWEYYILYQVTQMVIDMRFLFPYFLGIIGEYPEYWTYEYISIPFTPGCRGYNDCIDLTFINSSEKIVRDLDRHLNRFIDHVKELSEEKKEYTAIAEDYFDGLYNYTNYTATFKMLMHTLKFFGFKCIDFYMAFIFFYYNITQRKIDIGGESYDTGGVTISESRNDRGVDQTEEEKEEEDGTVKESQDTVREEGTKEGPGDSTLLDDDAGRSDKSLYDGGEVMSEEMNTEMKADGKGGTYQEFNPKFSDVVALMDLIGDCPELYDNIMKITRLSDEKKEFMVSTINKMATFLETNNWRYLQ